MKCECFLLLAGSAQTWSFVYDLVPYREEVLCLQSLRAHLFFHQCNYVRTLTNSFLIASTIQKQSKNSSIDKIFPRSRYLKNEG